MNKYEIPCTAEQTAKAIELGAPLEVCNYNEVNTDRCFFNKDTVSCYRKPTAEQMIGWLEEQGFIFYIYKNRLWNGEVEYGYKWYGSSYDVNSRQEATLAVIDAALDYLIKTEK